MDAEQLISEAENFSPPKSVSSNNKTREEIKFDPNVSELRKIPHGLSHKHSVKKSPNRRNSTSAIRSPLSTLHSLQTPSKLKSTLTCPRPTKYSEKQIVGLTKLKMNLDSKLKDASLGSDQIMEEDESDENEQLNGNANSNADVDEEDEERSKETSFATPSKIQAYQQNHHHSILHTPNLSTKRRSSESNGSAKKVKIVDSTVKTPLRPTEPVAASPSNEQASRIIDNSHLLLDAAKSPNVSSNLTSPLANVSHHINSSHITHGSDSIEHIDARTMLAEESIREEDEEDDISFSRRISSTVPTEIPALNYDTLTGQSHGSDFDPIMGSPTSKPTFSVRQIEGLQRDHQSEISKLGSLIDLKNSTILKLHDSVNQYSVKAESLLNTITSLQCEQTKLKENEKVFTMRVSSLESHSRILTKQLKLKDSKIEQLNNKVSDVELTHSKSLQQIEEMEHNIVSLQANLEVERDSNAELNSRIDTYTNTVSNLRVNLKERVSEIEALSNEKEKLIAKIDELSNELLHSKEDLSLLHSVIEERDSQLKDLTEFKNDIESALESANQQLNELAEKEKITAEELETITQDYKLTKLQSDEQLQEIEDLHNSLEAKMKEMDLLFDEKEEILRSLAHTREDLDEKTKSNEELESERDLLKVEINSSKKLVEEFKDQVVNLEKEYQELQTKNQILNSELSEWQHQVSELHQLLDEATKNDSEQIESLQVKISELEKEIQSLKAATKAKDESLDLKKKENEELNESLQQANSNLEELHTKVNNLKKDLSEQEESTETKLKTLAQDLYVQYAKKHEKKVAVLRQGYEAKWSKRLQQLDDDNGRLAREIESLKKQLRTEREEKNHLLSIIKN